MDPQRFREVIGSFATGVTLVTTRDGEGRPLGLTVNAVSSVSLEPVLVMVCIDRGSGSHDPLLAHKAFGVSVLGTEQEGLARRFALGERGERFDGVALEEGRTGCPIITGALAWLDCRVWKAVEAGDHTVVLGEVLDGGARPGAPLIYYRGSYRRIGP